MLACPEHCGFAVGLVSVGVVVAGSAVGALFAFGVGALVVRYAAS